MLTDGLINYYALDGMVDWVRVVDINNDVIYANRAMKSALGADIVGAKCWSAFHADRGMCPGCLVQRSIRFGEVATKEEQINGSFFSVKTSPVYGANGKIVAAVEVFRDITRERNLERELISRNRLMTNALDFARKVQEAILPAEGVINGLKLKYIYNPSEYLSGDMFDVCALDDYTVGMYMSDVVGHGIGASMMTMFIRQTMRTIMGQIDSPGIALSELNRRFKLLGLEPDRYFTIFYAVYDSRNKTLCYSNAGHNSLPIILSADGNLSIIESKGYPISRLSPDKIYDEGKLVLRSGDRIFLYTDGILEAKDELGEEFGMERLLELLRNENTSDLKYIEESISEHMSKSQKDDIAMMYVEIEE